MNKAGGQRLKILMEVILSGGSQGGQGTAMEAVHQRHDGIAVRPFLHGRVFSCHLDGTFVCLGTGIGEENLLHAGSLAQKLGKPCAGLGIVQVGRMLHLTQLRCDRLGPGLVTEAEGSDTDTAAHIYIRLTVHIHHPAALAGDDLHRETLVGVGNVSLIHIHKAHNLSPPKPWYRRPHPSAAPSKWSGAHGHP